MRLTLPEPPSANRYWRVYRGHPVTSAEARAYKRRVQLTTRARPLEGNVCVMLHWFRGRRSGDLDNRLKVALDALRGIAFADDKQVVAILAYRHEDKAHPRIEVTIEEAA